MVGGCSESLPSYPVGFYSTEAESLLPFSRSVHGPRAYGCGNQLKPSKSALAKVGSAEAPVSQFTKQMRICTYYHCTMFFVANKQFVFWKLELQI